MIDAGLSAFMSLFLIFGQEGRQLELLQMVLQEKLRACLKRSLCPP
jgi:hypothetical protein